jgi:PadR family transcriptional regulator
VTKGSLLSELEQLALLALIRLGTDAYGPSIQRELEETAGRTLSIATIYVTLVRLEKRGLVSSWRSDPEPIRGGKAKRFFAVTPLGMKALNASRAVMNRMWKGIEATPGRGS